MTETVCYRMTKLKDEYFSEQKTKIFLKLLIKWEIKLKILEKGMKRIKTKYQISNVVKIFLLAVERKTVQAV